MRERRIARIYLLTIDRITPAYAGKTGTEFCIDGCYGDHPRVCGKDCVKLIGDIHPKGSPPRMRERLPVLLRASEPIRITPAYAGKTSLCETESVPA